MAKQSFAKLNAKLNTENNLIYFNNQPIEIKQYLPILDKIKIVQDITNDCVEENPYYFNPGIVEIKQVMAIIENYTNLSFTEKQKEEFAKTYDILVSSGLARQIILEIDDAELNSIEELLFNNLKNIYQYNNSVASLVQSMSQSEQNIEKLQELFQDNDLTVIKEVLSKLG